MKPRTHLLILLLAIFALPLSICKATIVFLDFTNGDTSGANILGSTPVVGTTWVGTDGGTTFQYGANSAGNAEATTTSMYTDGSGRTIYSGLTSALGAGKILTVSYNLIDFGANWNTNGNGYSGVSLYTGFTGTAGSGSEQQFIGRPSGDNSIGLDGGTTGHHASGNQSMPTVLTFTYVYDTGAWTLTTVGGVNMSGIGTAHQAFNAVRIANGNGGDIDLNDFTVDISSVSTPSLAAASPANGSYSAIRTNISIEAIDGNPTTINTNTVVMQVDGSAVTPVITKSGNITTISYSPGSPLSAGVLHTAFFTVKDSNNNSYTNSWSFTTGHPSLPVTLAGPFSTGGGNDLTIFTATGEGWLGANYNSSSSRTLYTRYSMEFDNLNGETGNGGGYGGLHFELGNAEHLIVGNNWGSINWSYDAAGGGAADLNITNTTFGINFGEWHTIVVRTDYVPNQQANVTIYFDPDFTQPEVNQNSQNITHLTTDVTFDNVRLRCGNGTASAEWTNIMVGTASTDVGFPPATAALFQAYNPPVSAPSAYVDTPISVQVVQGSVGINTNNISMILDGNPVTPTFSVSGGTITTITINYQPSGLFVTNSSHTVSVNLTDTNGTPYSTSWSFTVDSYPTLPVTIAGPIDVTGGGLGDTIFGATNEWISANYQSSSTNTLYTRFSMSFFDANGTPGTFGGLHFYEGSTEHLITGENFGSANWSLDGAAGGGGELDLLPVTPIVLNQFNTMVVKSVYSPNAPTAETIWLNPDFTKTEGNQPQAPLTLSENNTFDTIRLRAGNGPTFAEYTNIVIAATATGVGFAVQPPVAVMSVVNSGGVPNLSWTSIGTLQQAPAVTGPWADSTNQANPQVLATTNSATFFRLRQ